MKHRNRFRRSAFTLIELLLVLGILVLLASVAVVGYGKIQESSNRQATQAMVDGARSAVDLYHTTMNSYPDELTSLITAPDDERERAKWAGPYLKDGKIPVDPWGTELKYERMSDEAGTGPAFHVWSSGPDKVDDTDDDIRSWTQS